MSVTTPGRDELTRRTELLTDIKCPRTTSRFMIRIRLDTDIIGYPSRCLQTRLDEEGADRIEESVTESAQEND